MGQLHLSTVRSVHRTRIGPWLAAVLLGVGLAALTSCGLIESEPTDGFAGWGLCTPEHGDNCIMLWGVSETADRFEVTVVAETATEVRIRVDAIGKKDEDDLVTGVQAFLGQPIGDRAVVDDATGDPVPLDPTRG